MAPRFKAEHCLVWLDVETTGLVPDLDSILEIATVITDATLSERIAGPNLAISHSRKELAGMSAWSEAHHGNSGLTSLAADSPWSMRDVETMLCEFVAAHVSGPAILAGSSIHFDRAFLKAHMPRFEAMFHYRMVDVSSFTEIARRLRPEVYAGRPQHARGHRAAPDVEASIELMAYYFAHLLKA